MCFLSLWLAIAIVNLCLHVGIRYLVGVRWMDQWKEYVGYRSDERSAGQKSAHPGPLDNFSLLGRWEGI